MFAHLLAGPVDPRKAARIQQVLTYVALRGFATLMPAANSSAAPLDEQGRREACDCDGCLFGGPCVATQRRRAA